MCVATTLKWLPLLIPSPLSVMESKLKIATYKCQGIKSSEPCIKNLLVQVHILAFQETWLCGDELQRPNTFSQKLCVILYESSG